MIYNAAEAVLDFESVGYTLYPSSQIDPDQLLDVMELYINGFGHFPVMRLDTHEEITVKPLERVGRAIILSSYLDEGLFASPYIIATDPPPLADYHVDVLAELHLTSDIGN